MPQVDYIHPELREILPIIGRVNDAIKGPQAVKAKEDTYLPRPNAADESKANKERYKAYLNRAIFYGVPGQTLEGLVSEVFAKEPVTTLPDPMAFIAIDCDASGLPLTHQSKSALRNSLANGGGGLFVDYPMAPEEYRKGQNAEAKELSKLDVEKLGLRPRILKYLRQDIINWRKQTVNGRVMLTLVVLRDKEVVDDDGFEAKTEERFRVLRLNVKPGEEVFYYVEMWKKTGRGFELVSTVTPVDGWGKKWDEIPFAPFGWEDNDISPNTVPLEAITELAFGHYRNSADYEDSCFLVGQPTPVYTGLTEDWVKDVMKGVAELGSRGGISLGKDMDAKLLQAEENSMPKEAMEHKERQMVALNAKLVQEGQVQKSATESSIQNASKTSVLGSSAFNISLAYERALRFVARFMKIEIPETQEGEEAVLSFELNTDFDVSKMTAQERAQLLQEWMSGGISLEEYRHNLKKAGVAYLEDEKFKDQIETEGGPPGSTTDDPGSKKKPPGKPGDEEDEPIDQ